MRSDRDWWDLLRDIREEALNSVDPNATEVKATEKMLQDACHQSTRF